MNSIYFITLDAVDTGSYVLMLVAEKGTLEVSVTNNTYIIC